MATILSKSTSSSSISGCPVQTESSPSPEFVLPPDTLPVDVAKDLVRWFKLLADETRLRILFYLLDKGELNVRALCDLLQLSQPAVSHHLALLRVDGLIECRRDGKHNFYRIVPQRFGQLLGMVFRAVPGQGPELRLGDSVLSLTRVDDA